MTKLEELHAGTLAGALAALKQANQRIEELCFIVDALSPGKVRADDYTVTTKRHEIGLRLARVVRESI